MKNSSLKDWLQAEPFTLSMSSGFFSFYAHAGMLAALLEAGCEPAKITGSSAGALVGGCWASGHDMETLKAELFSLAKEDFWDPSFGFGFLKGQKFRDKLAEFLKVSDFDLCRVPVALSAYDVLKRETEVLKSGSLADAVYASCAFPFLFQPININGNYYLDGGIKDRPAFASLLPEDRVLYHHIKSRSPWRKKNSAALKVPSRENMQVIAIDNIPRVGPNQMELGPSAFQASYQATQALLAE